MLHDFRIAWRSLARSPLFTLTAAGSLALGIAACTVIFSVVYTLLLRPLPYPQPGQLVHLGLGNPAVPGGAFAGVAPATVNALRADPRAGFTALGGLFYNYMNLTGVPAPAQLTVGEVTTDYFRVYGVPARLGRTFAPADCRAASPPTAVLSDKLWRTQFNAAPEVIGQTVTLDDAPRTVIGVMPAAFQEPFSGGELWLPLAEDGAEMQSPTARLITMGRLADSAAAGFAHARAALLAASANLAQTDPAQYQGWRLEARPLQATVVDGGTRHALWLLLGAVACVLLVTCANVANLQLVRAGARRREIGVRLALGASRGRIMRQSLAESLLLAAVGGGAGLLAAGWGVDGVAALLPPGYSPWQEEISLSWPVLGFAAAVAALAGVASGGLPAWFAARQPPAGSLAAGAGERGSSGGPRGARVRGALVVAEIALAVVLLAGAGLMGRSFLATLRTSAGFRTERTLTLNLSLSDARYPDAARRAEFYRRLLAGAAAVPGASGVALSSTEPFNWWLSFKFTLPGQSPADADARRQTADYDAVNPAYFRTLDVPVLQGRAFDERDNASAPPVMVVNDAFARRWFPAGDALGKVVTVLGFRAPAASLPFEIVGVTASVRREGLDKAPPAQMFVCCLQKPPAFATLYVRAAGALTAESLTRPVEGAIWQVDPDQPIGKVSTLERGVAASVAPARLYVVLFAVFAALTLGLAVLGIYGTVSYSVGQRTRELGIRLALGARREDILRLVLGQGARLIALGLALGLAASLGLSRLLTSLLFGVKPTDPATLSGVALLLGASALLASYLPARRATRIDPLEALRDE